MKKFTAILLIALMLVTMVTGCSLGEPADTGKGDAPSQGTEKPNTGNQGSQDKKEKVFVKSTSTSPSGVFNPVLINDAYNGFVTNLVFESLVVVTPELTFAPKLAKSWEISEDNRSITFHLVENAKWHDGKPFTADDVKFTYEFLANKDYPGPRASLIAPIDGFKEMKEGKADSLKGIEVIDPYTVKITTTKPYAPFLEKIGFEIKIIAKHIWENVDIKQAMEKTDLLRNPIGTGPFKVQEFVVDRYTTTVKNAEYWAGEPKMDKVIIQVVNKETAQAQLLNGEIHFNSVSSMNPDDLKIYEDAGFKLLETYGNSFQGMLVNNQAPLLNNKYVRQALAYGINRQGLVDSLLYGHGVIANTIYPSYFWAHPGEDKLNPYEYSPEKAIELLTTKAGWEYKDGKMYAEGKPVKFKLSYSSGSRTTEGTAAVIQENLKNIGIEIELQSMESATLRSMLATDGGDAYDLAINGYHTGVDADIRNYLHTEAILKGNTYRYSNPEVDKLLEEGANLLDQEKRKPIYEKIAKIVNEDMPVIFFYNKSTAMVIPSNLKGFEPTSRTDTYNAHLWEWAE